VLGMAALRRCNRECSRSRVDGGSEPNRHERCDCDARPGRGARKTDAGQEA
jgi:hypothetical protein